jgi:hypothetical protein
MDKKILQAVCKEIYQKFPQVSGCEPTVKPYPGSKSANQENATYLLIFTNQGKPKNQVPVTTWVRVVVSSQGKIIKLTSSR